MNRRSFLKLLGGTALAPVVAKMLPEKPLLDPTPSHGVLVKWDPTVPEADYHHTVIYRDGLKIGDVIRGAGMFVDTDPLEPGKVYEYRVRCVAKSTDRGSDWTLEDVDELRPSRPEDYVWLDHEEEMRRQERREHNRVKREMLKALYSGGKV